MQHIMGLFDSILGICKHVNIIVFRGKSAKDYDAGNLFHSFPRDIDPTTNTLAEVTLKVSTVTYYSLHGTLRLLVDQMLRDLLVY